MIFLILHIYLLNNIQFFLSYFRSPPPFNTIFPPHPAPGEKDQGFNIRKMICVSLYFIQLR